MSVREFFAPGAKERVGEVVRLAESHTSAELVVVAHRRSGDYRHVDLFVGGLFATVGLLVFLFHPMEFAIDWFPLEFAALFALGAVLSWSLPAIRRTLTTASWRTSQLRRNAFATFRELGVDTTSGRTGVLVLVSALERDCFIVCDRAIDEEALGEPWKVACAMVREAARGRRFGSGDFDDLLKGLEALGKALAVRHPRAQDDVNELTDEARIA